MTKKQSPTRRAKKRPVSKRPSTKPRVSPGATPAVKAIVGWREWAALPELEVVEVKAKVDTGARTSALHAFNVVPFIRNGADWVRFEVHPLQRNDALVRTCACPALDYRWVTNSGGGREKRFVIETPVRLGDQEWPIEVTLTDRDQMGFRMLLGRTALKGRFAVDPGRSYCMKRPIKRAPRRSAGARKTPTARELESTTMEEE